MNIFSTLPDAAIPVLLHSRTAPDVKILNNMTSIGEETFGGCTGLLHITIPANVVTIPDNAFNNCSDSLTVYCKKDTTALDMALANGIDYSFDSAPAFDNMPAKPIIDKDVDVSVNDMYLYFDQEPIIEDGRTLVPLRTIFEALGAEVDWNSQTQTVTASKKGTTITLQIGSNTMYKNGKEIVLDVPAALKNGRTLVPVRAISEAFGCDVTWNAEQKQVEITE